MTSVLKVDTIQSSGGTTGLTIDSTGRVLTPARPAFRVYKMSGSGGQSATGVISFTNEDYDIGSGWNTNYYQAPVSGVYQFNLAALGSNTSGGLTPGANNIIMDWEISTDSGSNWGSKTRMYVYIGTSGHPNCSQSVNFKLDAGDRIRLNVSAQGLYFDSTNERNLVLSGYLVG